MAKATTERDEATAARLEAALDTLALACRILEMEGHASRTLGHAAMRDPEGRGFWLKRWGISFGEVREAGDFILLDFDGRVRAGEGRRHSEWPIHAEILKARPDVEVTVHSHPFHGRIFSASDEPLRAVSSAGSWFPAPPPRYEATSELVRTPERGRALAGCLGDHFAVFLRNHGVVFCGRSIAHATLIGIQLEEACREQLLIGASGLAWSWPGDEERARRFGAAGKADSLDQYFDYFSRKLAWREKSDGPYV
ncbi:MAG TPA: class II aldolase/adducin family protein [Alphaproteobacteria bacterium]